MVQKIRGGFQSGEGGGVWRLLNPEDMHSLNISIKLLRVVLFLVFVRG